MSKVAKKAVAKKATKHQLKALITGTHGIDGGRYTFEKGETITLTKKSHYDSMKELVNRFSEV